MEKEKSHKIRYHILDEYRGFMVLNMIAYHTLWDLVYLFGWDLGWYKGDERQIWRIFIGGSFILVSGFCWQLGKKQVKRGLLVFGGGAVVTLVTLLFMPNAKIIFGVLTLHGSAMLIVAAINKLLQKIPAGIGLVVSFLLFLFVFSINNGYLGFFGIEMVKLPQAWYANWITTFLGLPMASFWSADYYSIFPWLFLYISGYFAYTILKNNKKLDWATRRICPPLGWIGKHAFLLYMLHQPVVYGVCVALDYMGII